MGINFKKHLKFLPLLLAEAVDYIVLLESNGRTLWYGFHSIIECGLA